MAQINTDLETLKTARDNMKTALEEKGQTVTKDIRTYAEAISNISGSENLDSVLNAQDEKLEALEQLLLTKTSGGGGGDTKPYIELEYIESTGTQYIDTGIFPTTINKVDTSAMFTSATDNRIFGARYSLSGDKFVIGVNYSVSSIENKIQYGYGSDSWRVLDYTYIPVNKYFNVIFEFVIDGSSGKITLDGTGYNVTSESGISQLNNTSIYLFAINTPYLESTQQFGIARIYSCKMYGSSGSLVRDFIPVKRKSDNEICMYDKVTKQFYTNLGTGTFVAGPEKYVPTEETTMNIFVQTTEPEVKKGIWLQTNKTMEHIYYDNIATSGTWLPTDTFNEIPYKFQASPCVYYDGCLYLIGTATETGRSYFYKFNINTNTFTKLDDLPMPCSRSSAVVIGDYIYLFGSSENSTYYRKAYKYSFKSETWSSITNIPYDVINSTITNIGTDIYLFGSGSNETQYRHYAYKYDTLTNTYTRLTDIPKNLYSTVLVTDGTDIYLVGGGDADYQRYIYRYNVIQNTYTLLSTSIPYNFYDGGVSLINGNIYMFGGGSAGDNKRMKTYKYDIQNDTYTQLTDIPLTFSYGGCCTVNNKVYLLGGASSSAALYAIQCFNVGIDEYENNSVLIANGTNYRVETFSNNLCILPIKCNFDDVYFYTTQDGLITDIPTYYGDGTQWVKFKN